MAKAFAFSPHPCHHATLCFICHQRICCCAAIEEPEKLQDFAAWGGPQFRAMMWRKMELVNEIMLQARGRLSLIDHPSC